MQSDAGTQLNLHRPSAQPTGLVEVDCKGMTRCLDAAVCSASRSMGVVGARSLCKISTWARIELPRQAVGMLSPWGIAYCGPHHAAHNAWRTNTRDTEGRGGATATVY